LYRRIPLEFYVSLVRSNTHFDSAFYLNNHGWAADEDHTSGILHG
jgi:hypothetical protein